MHLAASKGSCTLGCTEGIHSPQSWLKEVILPPPLLYSCYIPPVVLCPIWDPQHKKERWRVHVDDQFAGEVWKTKLVFLALKAKETVVSISIWRAPYILLMDPKCKAVAHSVGVVPI